MSGIEIDIMNAVFMAGAIVASTGIAWRLLAPGPWQRSGLVLVTGGWLACIGSVLAFATERPLISAMTVGVAITAGWLTTRILVQRTNILLILAAVAVPVRVPVPLGSDTANLLLPLYAIIALGLLAQIRREHGPLPTQRHPADIAVAALTMWSCLSCAWTYARPDARVDIALFILPFAALYVLIRTWHGADQVSLRPAATGFISSMGCAAIIAMYQHATRTIWTNPKVMVANTYAPDFRVNSFFWDPNMLGRYLTLALLVLAAIALHETHRKRRHIVLVGMASICGIALWYTYSQSSFAALSAGLVVAVFAASGRRVRIALGMAVMVGLMLSPVMLRELSGKDTRSRETVVTAGFKLASLHPVRGIGIGSYESGVSEIARNRGDATPRLQSSHTSPMTVLVELGVVGLGLLIMFMTAGIAPALLTPLEDPERWWAAAATVALVVHSMFYAAFIEDPMTWAALAIVTATRMRRDKDSDKKRSGLDEPHTRPTPSTREQNVVAPPVD